MVLSRSRSFVMLFFKLYYPRSISPYLSEIANEQY